MAAFRFLLPAAAALLAVVGVAHPADAGWVTVKNDTNKAIVIQETVCVNGQPRQGKPIRLLPGESLREFQTSPGTRTVEVFDGQNPSKSLGSATLALRADPQVFSVTTDGRSARITAVAGKGTDTADVVKK